MKRSTQFFIQFSVLPSNLDDGLSVKQYKDGIGKEMEKQRFIQKKITPNIQISDFDLQKEYEAHLDRYQTFNKVHFIEVFLTSEKFTNVDDLKKVADTISVKLKANQSVSALVKQYSSGAFAANGGDSGLISASDLRPEIKGVLFKLNKNEVSPPLPVAQGVFIFKLLEKADPAPIPFNQVMNDVRGIYGEKMVQKELKKYLMGVKDQTYVEIMK